MANHRRERINDEVRGEMAVILRDIKDPRISEAFVSITAAQVTPDLKYAKIYYSHLRGDTKEIEKGLKSSAGYFRRRLAQSLNLRVTPELTFQRDLSIAHGAHISSIINSFEYSDDARDDENNNDNDTADSTPAGGREDD